MAVAITMVLRKLTDGPPCRGQAAIVENLKQQVPDIGVGLLDLIQQNDLKWLRAHGIHQTCRPLRLFGIADEHLKRVIVLEFGQIEA